MGGKVWSVEEERCFWTQIISRSQKRVGVDKANAQKSWDDLAKDMKEIMGPQGRRDYTPLGLFEHFFQNAVKKRFSPHAGRFAREYITRALAEGGETLQEERTTAGRARAQETNRGRRRDEELQLQRPNLNRPSPQAPARSKLAQKRAPPRNNDDDDDDDDDDYQDEKKPSPRMKKDVEEKPSPRMKREPSPPRSEADLPPLIPRAAGAHPGYRGQDLHSSPGDVQTGYPVVVGSDDWDAETITNSASRHGPSPGVPRGRTAQMEARMERRTLETPSRIRQRGGRIGTPGSAVSRGFDSPGHGYEGPQGSHDPFVESPLHRDRDMVMANGPEAHQSPAQYRGQGNGMPSGHGYHHHPYDHSAMMSLGVTGDEYYGRQARMGMGQQHPQYMAHYASQWDGRSSVPSSAFQDAVDRANQHHAAQQRGQPGQNNEAWQHPSARHGHGRDDHSHDRRFMTPGGPDYSSSYYHHHPSPYERQGPGSSHNNNFNGLAASPVITQQRGDMPPPTRPHHGGQVAESPASPPPNNDSDHDEEENTSPHSTHQQQHDEENASPHSTHHQQQHAAERAVQSIETDADADADAEGEEDLDEPEPQQVTNVPAQDQSHDDDDEGEGEGEVKSHIPRSLLPRTLHGQEVFGLEP
ncbi:hypothetical protein V8F06_003500 [Rhypophila decipiens]